MAYIIVNKDNPQLAWNNSGNFWDYDDYDTFDDEEKIIIPKNGEIVTVPWDKKN